MAALLVKDGQLKTHHKHHYKIQGQLALTGLLWCDLVVGSGSGSPFVQRVEFDKDLWELTMRLPQEDESKQRQSMPLICFRCI